MKKKFITKTVTGLMATAMLATYAGGIGSVNAASNDDITSAMNGYKNVLASIAPDMNYGPGVFSVADFNSDGMPDLLYIKESRLGRTREFFTYNNGQIIKMDESEVRDDGSHEAYLNVDRNYYVLSPEKWITPEETDSEVDETTEEASDEITEETTEDTTEQTTEEATDDITDEITNETSEASNDSFSAALAEYKNVLTAKGDGVGAFAVFDVNGDGILDLYYVDSTNNVEDVYIFIDGELYKSEGMKLTNVNKDILVSNTESNYYLVNPDYYNK